MQPIARADGGAGQYNAGSGSGSGPPQKRLKGDSGTQVTLSITAKGYEYMLLDIQNQVWLFMLECLKKSVSSQVDILYMVFMLSFCRVGTGYAISLLSPPQQHVLKDLCEMGLVFITRDEEEGGVIRSRQVGGGTLFYPTHIAISMLHTSPADGTNTPSSGGSGVVLRGNVMNSMSLTIIVETNFQVVAYVTSKLHLAMLSLFVDTRSMIRMPNMVSGVVKNRD